MGQINVHEVKFEDNPGYGSYAKPLWLASYKGSQLPGNEIAVYGELNKKGYITSEWKEKATREIERKIEKYYKR